MLKTCKNGFILGVHFSIFVISFETGRIATSRIVNKCLSKALASVNKQLDILKEKSETETKEESTNTEETAQ